MPRKERRDSDAAQRGKGAAKWYMTRRVRKCSKREG